MANKIQFKSSIRVAPLIEELSPPVVKRPTFTMQYQHVRGPLLEIQTRVRHKEAKRKKMEAESEASKKRCDREGRIAKVQIEAYWDLYPLPLSIEEAKHTHQLQIQKMTNSSRTRIMAPTRIWERGVTIIPSKN